MTDLLIPKRGLRKNLMTATISRLYNSYADAREAVRNLEAAGVAHSDINIIASNADNWYASDHKADKGTFPDGDLDGKDDRSEAAGAGSPAQNVSTVAHWRFLRCTRLLLVFDAPLADCCSRAAALLRR